MNQNFDPFPAKSGKKSQNLFGITKKWFLMIQWICITGEKTTQLKKIRPPVLTRAQKMSPIKDLKWVSKPKLSKKSKMDSNDFWTDSDLIGI
jgi:hypothetical protein